MKKIMYVDSEGNTCVVHPVINIDEQITDDEAFERAYKKLPANALNIQVVEPDVVPKDRAFRNAWKLENKSITVDIPKAKEIWKNKMREARAPKLLSLDTEYMRADEKGDAVKKADVAAKKQLLRDITTHPDLLAAQTADEIKAVWPATLG